MKNPFVTVPIRFNVTDPELQKQFESMGLDNKQVTIENSFAKINVNQLCSYNEFEGETTIRMADGWNIQLPLSISEFESLINTVFE